MRSFITPGWGKKHETKALKPKNETFSPHMLKIKL